jgi:plasmid maintenance system antidote protein VapI
MPPVPPPVGDVLAEAVKARGLTWRGLAKALRVHEQFVVKIRKGQRAISAKSVARWIKVLGLEGEERQRFVDAAVWSQLSVEQRSWAVEYFAR